MENILIKDNHSKETLIKLANQLKNIFDNKINIDASKIDLEKIKNTEEFIVQCLKFLDDDVEIESYLYSKQFSDFTNIFPINKNEFTKFFEFSKELKREEFLKDRNLKKMLSETLSELPNSLARIYNINLGLEIKADGTEVTLKEYSMLNNEDHETNLKLLESAKKLLDKKIKRKIGKK